MTVDDIGAIPYEIVHLAVSFPPGKRYPVPVEASGQHEHSREGPHDEEVEGGARLDGIHITNRRGVEGGPANIEVLDEERAITMCGDRLYSEWAGHWDMLVPVRPFTGHSSHVMILSDGVPRKVPGVGALFSERYLPRVGDPEPWICPVRDCQTIFADAWPLGDISAHVEP